MQLLHVRTETVKPQPARQPRGLPEDRVVRRERDRDRGVVRCADVFDHDQPARSGDLKARQITHSELQRRHRIFDDVDAARSARAAWRQGIVRARRRIDGVRGSFKRRIGHVKHHQSVAVRARISRNRPQLARAGDLDPRCLNIMSQRHTDIAGVARHVFPDVAAPQGPQLGHEKPHRRTQHDNAQHGGHDRFHQREAVRGARATAVRLAAACAQPLH